MIHDGQCILGFVVSNPNFSALAVVFKLWPNNSKTLYKMTILQVFSTAILLHLCKTMPKPHHNASSRLYAEYARKTLCQ